MLNTLRNVTFIKAMMWIVAGAFVGLIVFEWGADFSGRSAGGPVGDTVGIVNGQKVSHRMFDQALRNAYQQAKGEDNADPDLAPLIRQTWDQIVAQILFAQQIEKYNLTVSDTEINFINRNQPAEWVRSQEFFQTDGQFDPAKYARFLDDPSTYSNPQMKQFVLGAEEAARQALLNQKLQEMVAGGVRVTSSEVRTAYVRQHEKVRVAYAGVEAFAVPDSLVSVSDEEVRAYYEAHGDEFHQDAAVQVAFVSFPKTPSAQDSADTETEIRDFLAEIRDGADFADLASNHSDDPGSARQGGDLGFFGRGQMVKAFEDTAFALEPGQVSNPFRTRFGWHILKVEERKGKGDSLRVRARHILLRITPGRNTLDSLRVAAEEFLDLAEEAGFTAAATEQNLRVDTSGFITAGGFFPLLGNQTAGLVNAFLNASPGRVSPTYETDDGIYIFELVAKRDAGPQPLEEVHGRILAKLKTRKKVDLAAQRLTPVLADARSGKPLKEAAQAHGVRYEETKLFSRTDVLPGVGGRNAFIGTAFRLQPEAVSDIVKTERGAYVLKVLEKQPIDESGFQAAQPELTRQLLTQKRNEVFIAWFTDLREKAEIEDNRHLFYSNF